MVNHQWTKQTESFGERAKRLSREKREGKLTGYKIPRK